MFYLNAFVNTKNAFVNTLHECCKTSLAVFIFTPASVVYFHQASAVCLFIFRYSHFNLNEICFSFMINLGCIFLHGIL